MRRFSYPLFLIILLSSVSVAETISLKSLSENLENKVNPIVDWFSSQTREDGKREPSSFQSAISELSNQLSAMKESVQHLNRGGNIKPMKANPDPPKAEPVRTDNTVLPVAQNEALIAENEVLIDQNEFGLSHEQQDVLEKIILLETMLQQIEIEKNMNDLPLEMEMESESEIDQEKHKKKDKHHKKGDHKNKWKHQGNNAKYDDDEDDEDVDVPKKQKDSQSDEVFVPSTTELKTSPLFESQSFIGGCHSAAQISTVAKMGLIYSDSDLSYIQKAYDSIVQDSKSKVNSFFDSMSSIPRAIGIQKKDEPEGDEEPLKNQHFNTVGLSIDVIVTLDSNAPIIPSIPENCISKFITMGELNLNGNGMECTSGNEDCKQCLLNIYQANLS